MVIRVLSDATVVANAVTAASAAAPESVTVAVAVTATCAAVGSDKPPVAVIVTVPPAAGAKTVYRADPALAAVVELLAAEVVIDTPLRSTVAPLNPALEVIPPVANRFV